MSPHRPSGQQPGVEGEGEGPLRYRQQKADEDAAAAEKK